VAKDKTEDLELAADIEFRRGLVVHTTVKEAQEVIYRLLAETPNGYFIWTSLDDSKVWWLRYPRAESKEVKQWLNGKETYIIHICDPIRYVEHAKRGEYRSLGNYSGYVNDNHDCYQCNQSVPVIIREAAARMTKMLNFTSKFAGV